MKIILIAVLILAVLAIIAWVAHELLKRSKPLPRSRQIEEARRVMLEVQHTDDIFASLPANTRAKLDKILKDTEE
jgi:serine protease inhibitor ecotin